MPRVLPALALLVACTGKPADDTGPTGDTGGGAVEPAAPFRAVTWNIDWLSPRTEDPADERPRNAIDHQMIRSLIDDNDFSLLGLQEIEGDEALENLRLDDSWDWEMGTSGWSQNLAILYKSDLFTVSDVREIRLRGTDWPNKDPLVATVTHRDGLAFTMVVVHHVPFLDNESAAERMNQAEQLKIWLSETLPADQPAQLSENVLLLGDFNDEFGGLNPDFDSLAAIEEAPAWRFATRQTDDTSNIGFDSLIDHIVLSEGLVPQWTEQAAADGCHVFLHDETDPWADYDGGYGNRPNLSTHRPVWIELDGAR